MNLFRKIVSGFCFSLLFMQGAFATTSLGNSNLTREQAFRNDVFELVSDVMQEAVVSGYTEAALYNEEEVDQEELAFMRTVMDALMSGKSLRDPELNALLKEKMLSFIQEGVDEGYVTTEDQIKITKGWDVFFSEKNKGLYDDILLSYYKMMKPFFEKGSSVMEMEYVGQGAMFGDLMERYIDIIFTYYLEVDIRKANNPKYNDPVKVMTAALTDLALQVDPNISDEDLSNIQVGATNMQYLFKSLDFGDIVGESDYSGYSDYEDSYGFEGEYEEVEEAMDVAVEAAAEFSQEPLYMDRNGDPSGTLRRSYKKEAVSVQSQEKMVLYFYHGEGCSHCDDAMNWFPELKKQYPELEIQSYEVWHDEANMSRLEKHLAKHDMTPSGVPTSIIGDEVIVGFDKEAILAAVKKTSLSAKPSVSRTTKSGSYRYRGRRR